jgi:hypothetical protein
MLRNSSIAFSAGAVGAVVSSAALLLAVQVDLFRLLGVGLSPSFSLPWAYQRLVWGGLWGLLLLLPLVPGRPWLRGFLIGLAPCLFNLLWLFPEKTPHGYLGLGMGTLTPAVVLLATSIWGWTAVFWHRAAGGR